MYFIPLPSPNFCNIPMTSFLIWFKLQGYINLGLPKVISFSLVLLLGCRMVDNCKLWQTIPKFSTHSIF